MRDLPKDTILLNRLGILPLAREASGAFDRFSKLRNHVYRREGDKDKWSETNRFNLRWQYLEQIERLAGEIPGELSAIASKSRSKSNFAKSLEDWARDNSLWDPDLIDMAIQLLGWGGDRALKLWQQPKNAGTNNVAMPFMSGELVIRYSGVDLTTTTFDRFLKEIQT